MARILIADDTNQIRELLGQMLDAGEHDVVGEAADGQEAIEKFRELQPDVMLLDLAMPKKLV